MILEFSDRQIEVRLPAIDSEADNLFVREVGKDVVTMNEDLPTAIQSATSLPIDRVLAELGLAFPRAAERFGGTAGTISLVRKP